MPAIIFPLFFYMAFAGGLSRVADVPGFDYYDYNAFQFIFVLLQSAAFGGVFIGFSIGADFDSGFTRRLFLAAPDRSAVFAGFGVAALVRAVMVWVDGVRDRAGDRDGDRGQPGRPRRALRPGGRSSTSPRSCSPPG